MATFQAMKLYLFSSYWLPGVLSINPFHADIKIKVNFSIYKLVYFQYNILLKIILCFIVKFGDYQNLNSQKGHKNPLYSIYVKAIPYSLPREIPTSSPRMGKYFPSKTPDISHI